MTKSKKGIKRFLPHLIVTAITLLILVVIAQVRKAKAVVENLVVVGEEEYMLGPRDDIPDQSFFTNQTTSGLRGFLGGGGNTTTFFGPNLDSLVADGVALQHGPAGNFDECGVWLVSTYKIDDQHWIGWYHAEEACDYSVGRTHKSMAFTESFDGGKTWTKPNYPNNQILTADTVFNGDTAQDDAGDGKVIKIGDYFYLFFGTDGPWGINVARSAVADLGQPGTWYKYYNGGYTEPGLGGHSSVITNMDSQFVVLNTYLNRYMTGQMSGKWGLALDFSNGTDYLNWEKFPGSFQPVYPEVSSDTDGTVDNWLVRDANSKQLYAYASFIGSDGNSDSVGQQFYLYYLKLFPGEGFDKRYLMRRKIEIKTKDDQFYAKALLTRYGKTSPKKTKVSTEIAKPSEGYIKTADLGYLASTGATGFHPLYECYIAAAADYLIYTGDPATNNWTYCASANEKYVRKIGYAADVATTTATQALYRCYDKANTDHFLSLDPNCEGKKVELRVGYIFPMSGANPSPTPTPTSTSAPTPTPTSIPKASPTPTPTLNPTPSPSASTSPDTTPPQVQITFPANNALVTKNTSVVIAATASDASGIAKVDFYVNNTLKCSDTTSPYSCKWTVPNQAGVAYTLEARAFDVPNNTASSFVAVTSQ